MKSISPTLRDRLASPSRTLAHLIRITRSDGVVHAYTDHDNDLVSAGILHKVAGAANPTLLETGLGLAVDNGDVSGVISDDEVTEADLARGVFDRARVVISLCDWHDPNDVLILSAFTVQETRVDSNGRFTLGLVGLQERLQKTLGRLLTPTCQTTFASAKCGKNAEEYAIDAIISGFNESGIEVTSTSGLDFTWGHVRFTSGALAGHKAEVREQSGRNLALWTFLPTDPAIGDTVRLYRGCPLTLDGCKSWNNVVNFRGFPSVPGPSAGSR